MLKALSLRSPKFIVGVASIAVLGLIAIFSLYAASTAQTDLNKDGKTDILDLSILLSQFGKTGSADINGSGLVDISDLSALLTNFGAVTSACVPAAFPSVLKTSGRTIVDENGCTIPRMRGFNAQVVPWKQADFQAMKDVGAGLARQVIFWDAFQPSAPAGGVGINGTGISQALVDYLDIQIKNAQATGIYSFLDIHLNVNRDPAWTKGIPNETERYATYGQTLTQFLANRYGNPASPQYTKSVIGLGLNEPPPTDSINPNPRLEAVQSNMIGWFRAKAPKWIGFTTFGYANSTPIYDRTWQSPTAANANPHAYDAVGGNVIIDFHDYLHGVSSSCVPANKVPYTSPQAQVRWPNGLPMNNCFSNTNYTTSSTFQSQHSLYIAPYKQFSINANEPLMVGEWGWVPGNTGGDSYISDTKPLWSGAGSVIELEWDFDVTPSQDQYAAYPLHVWTPWTLRWMAKP